MSKEIVVESAIVGDLEPIAVYRFAVVEAATIHGEASASVSAVVSENAVLGDTVAFGTMSGFIDAAVLSDVVAFTTPSRVVVNDALLISDGAAYSGLRASIVEAAVLGESYVATIPSVRVVESALVGDVVVGLRHAKAVVSEAATLGDLTHVLTHAQVVESAVVDDACSPLVRHRQVANETALLGDISTYRLIQSQIVVDSAIVSEALAGFIRHHVSVQEYAEIYETVLPPPLNQAWVANTKTFAMSRFTNYPFGTMTSEYGASHNKVWRLGGALDDGVQIDAWVETGDVALGAVAHPSVLYAEGTFESPMETTVTMDLNGQRASYTYTQDIRNGTAERTHRTLLGKGLRGQYARFKLYNAGAAMVLTGADVLVATSQRRV